MSYGPIKYWIIRGRSFVRNVLHRCVTCCRFERRAHYPPPPPPLPAFRVKEAPAFAYTGVDFAGPLYVKGSNDSKEIKVWICLLTCCVVRAIHLEVTRLNSAVLHTMLQTFHCQERFPNPYDIRQWKDVRRSFQVTARHS